MLGTADPVEQDLEAARAASPWAPQPRGSSGGVEGQTGHLDPSLELREKSTQVRAVQHTMTGLRGKAGEAFEQRLEDGAGTGRRAGAAPDEPPEAVSGAPGDRRHQPPRRARRRIDRDRDHRAAGLMQKQGDGEPAARLEYWTCVHILFSRR